jgi:hypothetical protein
MDAAQALALTVAGVVLPVVQEKLAGAKIAGTTAIWLNFLAAIAIAIVATAMSGGFGAYDPNDPSAFVGAMLGKAAGIFALSQIVFHSAQPTVAKLGGTAPPSDSAPPTITTLGPAPSDP